MTSPDPECIFCKIAAGEIPAALILDSPSVLSFLDVNPLSEGHVLVIPRDHYTRLEDLPSDAAREVLGALPAVGKALLKVTGADGFNLLQNNGTAAGQVVHHVHFHLIPRCDGDGLGYRWNAGSYAPGRNAELVTAYRNALT